MEANGTFEVLPKKEVILIKKEKEKLDKFFTGIKDMTEIPQAMVVVDPKTEHNAVAEARKLNIPIFGLVDTNCDPDDVDYVIPANDDAVRSVKLIVATLANAVVEANGGTPIVIEFPDEPEEKPERKPRQVKEGAPRRERKPRQVKAEDAPAEEAKEEAAVEEAVEEVVEAVKEEVAEDAPVEETPATEENN